MINLPVFLISLYCAPYHNGPSSHSGMLSPLISTFILYKESNRIVEKFVYRFFNISGLISAIGSLILVNTISPERYYLIIWWVDQFQTELVWISLFVSMPVPKWILFITISPERYDLYTVSRFRGDCTVSQFSLKSGSATLYHFDVKLSKAQTKIFQLYWFLKYRTKTKMVTLSAVIRSQAPIRQNKNENCL